jgi:hypothetical protein
MKTNNFNFIFYSPNTTVETTKNTLRPYDIAGRKG